MSSIPRISISYELSNSCNRRTEDTRETACDAGSWGYYTHWELVGRWTVGDLEDQSKGEKKRARREKLRKNVDSPGGPVNSAETTP